MRIFVTGATGFIGSHFVRAALAAGHTVTALRRGPDSRPVIALDEDQSGSQLTWIDGGLGDVATHHLKNHDALVHLAAAGVKPGAAQWKECFEVNVSQSLNFWLRAADAGVEKFLICGSCFEYGRAADRYDLIPADAPLEPTGPYHASKAAASMAAHGLGVQRKLQLAILRPFHVFGEGESADRLWPSLRRAAERGEDFPMTLGEQVRDFIPVGDIAEAFLRCLGQELTPGVPLVANLGTGKPQTLRDFAGHWWKAWGATGSLLLGQVPYRTDEVMRYVPFIIDEK